MTPARGTLAAAVVAVGGAFLGGGCSLWVDGELTAASSKIGDGGEGEGEGEGGGEGEGEGEGDTDPACEDRERLVVVTKDPEDPLHVYRLVAGGIVPLAPTGFVPPDGALVDENGDSAANIEGAAFEKDAAGTLFFLVDSSRFYAVDPSTLLQLEVRTPEKAVRATGFSSINGVTATPRFVIAAGLSGLAGLDRQGAVASGTVDLGSGGFHSAVTFKNAGVTFVAANSESGYQVLATADENGQPAAAAGADDDTRFGSFGGSQARRGLAYDAVTGSLLLGDDDSVIVPKAPGFALPPATSDYALPSGSFVSALGARGGKGYVATESGDVFEIDLAQDPPQTVEVSSWDTLTTAGIPQQVLVGCKRVVLVVGGFGGPTIFQYARDTLEPFGGGPEVHDIIDALLVDKADLALAGDL